MRMHLARASLFLTAVLFGAVLWFMAAEGHDGGFALLLAIPLFMALLSLTAWFSWRQSKTLHRAAWATLGFLVLFTLGAAATPAFLHPFSEGIVNLFVEAYRVAFDKTPAETVNRATDSGFNALLRLAIQAQGAETLDLRAMNVSRFHRVEEGPWTRLCVFAPRTSEEHMKELAQFKFGWSGIGSYSFHRGSDHYAAILVASDTDIVEWADIPESIAVFEGSFCVDRARAVFKHVKSAHDGVGPTLAL
jgi:hypothetical protein